MPRIDRQGIEIQEALAEHLEETLDSAIECGFDPPISVVMVGKNAHIGRLLLERMEGDLFAAEEPLYHPLGSFTLEAPVNILVTDSQGRGQLIRLGCSADLN